MKFIPFLEHCTWNVRRNQCCFRERLYEDSNGVGGGGGCGGMEVPLVDYTREILGIREEGDGMSVATLD